MRRLTYDGMFSYAVSASCPRQEVRSRIARSILRWVSNGMDAPTHNCINVPKSKRYINPLNREGPPS